MSLSDSRKNSIYIYICQDTLKHTHTPHTHLNINVKYSINTVGSD